MVDIFCGPCIKGISPGTLSGNRLAIETDHSVFVASHHQVFNIKVKYPEKLTNLKQQQFESIQSNKLECHLENEIVNLRYDSNLKRIFVIDSNGNFEIIQNVEKEENEKKKKKIGNTTNEFGSKGPCSIAFNPLDSESFATSRFFYKDLTIYKGEQEQRKFSLLNYPTDLNWFKVNSKNHLCCIEYNRISIYDERAKDSVAQVSANRGCLYTLAQKNDYEICASGEDRSIYCFDTRKWKSVNKWDGSLKYTVSYLDFEKTDKKDKCFVGSFDSSELRHGDFNGETKALYADSRWLGLDRREKILAGISEKGKLYIIKGI